MFLKAVAFFTTVCRYFYLATYGEDVDNPIWYRRSGKSLVCIYNNHKAAEKAAANHVANGYNKAKLGPRGVWANRLQKVYFREPIREAKLV